MHPVLFRLTLFDRELLISTYGFSIAVGIFLAFFLTYKRSQNISKAPFDFTADLLFYILIPAFIGARVGYIIAEFPAFLQSPGSFIFARGGFVFLGGVIFGFAGGLYYARKKKVPYRKLADICTPGFGIAHFFGRIGCFLNGCCYGLATDSNLSFPFQHLQNCGCQFHYIQNNEVHALPGLHLPTQLYEAFFALFMTVLTLYLSRNPEGKQGRLLFLYLMSYSVFRFFLEFLRGDDRGIHIFFLSFSQILSIIIIIILIICRKKLISHDA